MGGKDDSAGRGGLNRLGVVEIVDGIRDRRFQSQDVVADCLARIDERDADVKAWVSLDRDDALRQAGLSNQLDGPLAGVPLGVKDVFDTARFPTEMGSALYDGHTPRFDAGCVAQMRIAGAVVLGKTATCEFAGIEPAPTRNPLDLKRTPGGSSSGSAAAVADFMVPFAFGTQTAGSVLRPAAFCGVVGFKPTYGLYSVSGTRAAAPTFDTVGLFARSVADIALLHRMMMSMEAQPKPRTEPPIVGVFRSHLWDTLQAYAAGAFDAAIEAIARAGARIVEVGMPEGFASITSSRAVINGFERARSLAGEWADGRGQLGALTAGICEKGLSISGEAYVQARKEVEAFRLSSSTLFDGVDLLVTPTTPGEAPVGFEWTGDPRLQELWTMLHLPSISIPAGCGPTGMPLGLQIVGRRFEDAALLATAVWVEAKLRDS